MSELQRALSAWHVDAMNCIRAAAGLIESEDLETAIKEFKGRMEPNIEQAYLRWLDLSGSENYGRIEGALVEACDTDETPGLQHAGIHAINWHSFTLDVGLAASAIATPRPDSGPSIEDMRQDWRGLAYYHAKLKREAFKAAAILRRDDTPRDPRAERDNWLYELKRDHGAKLTPKEAFGMQTSGYGFADAWKPLKASTIAKLWQGDPRLPKGKPGCPKQAKS